ncbi:citrate lyase holo-[acyl-carrier protein] synthase [Peptoniphilus indolicus]|uniref:citrate lyase holo-[acyl-carrier protein] synthase n=2 Tax=Peptoniphilus indolicus TaxID=33030 RepID=A0A379DAL9_9FIRM|nr:citrate lyase holo-[acyl-carrier protein] synthase [Peptoniphilus indolicus]SUB74621.1 2'-(5''-triphosphoribosyl)-3'-dephospho-CoA:apo-citrate lyase [Peptoniphilus indolicus]
MEENLKDNIFNDGSRPSIVEVMDRREERVYQIRQLLNSENCVVCLKLNIPGEVKNNDWILKVFDKAVEKIDKKLLENGIDIEKKSVQNLKTGPEYIFSVIEDSKIIKEYMVEIEEETPIGRLYDIDVETADGSVSRQDINKEERKCFICDKPSKICSSSRAHSVEEMLAYISGLILNEIE